MKTRWSLIIIALTASQLDRPAFADVLRVDASSNATSPDGSDWDHDHCFKYLQDAIAAASSGDTIKVAQGIYHPDDGSGQTPGDRAASFAVNSGVTIRGGYAGLAALPGGDPDAHNPSL